MTDSVASKTKYVPGPGKYDPDINRNSFYKPFYKIRR